MDQLEFRIRTKLARLEQQLSPSTTAACRQGAWHIRHQLTFIMQHVDWEDHLIREIERDLKARGVPLGAIGPVIAAVLLAIAAIIMMIGTMIGKAIGSAAKDVDDEAKKKVDEDGRKKVAVKLAELADKLVAKFERKGEDPTFRPVGRP